jgi:hypothetical protein
MEMTLPAFSAKGPGQLRFAVVTDLLQGKSSTTHACDTFSSA